MPERLRQPRGGSNCARGTASSTGRARPFRASIAVLLLAAQLAGCYHYVPVPGSALQPGAEISVGITDRGRVALTDPVGPGVRRIGGRVAESTDSLLVLSVLSVQYFDLSAPVKWRGERIEVSRDFASEIRERRLSRPRTWIMAGLVAVAAGLASRLAITGFGGDPGSDRPGGGEPGQQ